MIDIKITFEPHTQAKLLNYRSIVKCDQRT